MDLHSGAPYWPLFHGLRTIAPPLTEPQKCDVAIIGSGITGALLAWTLARDGARVVVLDRRDLAQGSTAASTALLQYDLDVPLHKLQQRIGIDRARRGFTIGIEAIDKLTRIAAQIGSPVERVPSLYFTTDERTIEDLAGELQARARADIDVTWIDEHTLERDWGVHAKAAIHSSVAAQMDPYDFTHKLLQHAMSRGALIFDRTTVLEIKNTPSSIHLTTDRGPEVTADFVVHATGYEAAAYLPRGHVELASTYALISEPLTPPAPPFMAWEFADPYIYLRWHRNRLVWGGEDVSFVSAARRDANLPRACERLQKRVAELLPSVRPEPAFAWTGTFGTTESGLGYIGPIPEHPRQFVALGFGGNGITFSAIATWLIADRIQGRDNPDAPLFALDRDLEVSAAQVSSRQI